MATNFVAHEHYQELLEQLDSQEVTEPMLQRKPGCERAHAVGCGSRRQLMMTLRSRTARPCARQNRDNCAFCLVPASIAFYGIHTAIFVVWFLCCQTVLHMG